MTAGSLPPTGPTKPPHPGASTGAARDVHAYYAAVTAEDILAVARDLLPTRITRSSGQRLEVDCPHHQSQSRTSLHVDGAVQRWNCFGCGVGGDVLQLVEFVRTGTRTISTKGTPMSTSHRDARDFLAARAGLPPLEQWCVNPADVAAIEARRASESRIFDLLTLAATYYHDRLVDPSNAETLAWVSRQWGFDRAIVDQFGIGFADNKPATHAGLQEVARAAGFDSDELVLASLRHAKGGFFFNRRVTFPFWSRGRVTYLIGRKCPATEASEYETAKYRKLRVHDPDDERGRFVSPHITKAALWGEDCLLARPTEVVIAEGVADAVALAARGIAVVSPVTVRFRRADREYIAGLFARWGTSRVLLALDNEISQVGIRAALEIANDIAPRVRRVTLLTLPLGPAQIEARDELVERFGIQPANVSAQVSKISPSLSDDDRARLATLVAASKIDVAEWFAAGGTAAQFIELSAASPSTLESSIRSIPRETPAGEDLDELLEPILEEIARLKASGRDRYLHLIRNVLAHAPSLSALKSGVSEARRLVASRPPPLSAESRTLLPFPAPPVNAAGGNGASTGSSNGSGTRSLKQKRHLTDVGNAERLVALHGADLHFCHPWNKWLIWDGTRFQVDDRGQIVNRAIDTATAIHTEIGYSVDRLEAELIAKWAKSSESKSKIDAMIALGRSQPGVPKMPDELDADPLSLNVLNGTLDLRNGTIRPHERGDLFTKAAPVTFDPDAACPTWLTFLDRIMAGNGRLIKFLQRAIGYSLTGLTTERCLFILWGSGANGKSTLLETIRALTGDYAVTTPTDTLMVRRTESAASNDLATLKGARFVSASEAEEGRRLAESRIKNLTGGDEITARFLYGEFFQFKPEFKIWLATNHKPIIRGADEGIWDRIRLIPFEVRIPPEERDPNLRYKLDEERAGILTWAVRGCLGWQREGLGMPAEIEAASSTYRDEMDVMGAFISDRCEIGTNYRETSALLYREYTRWCEDTGERPLTQRAFGQRILERGIESIKSTGGTRVWDGIRIAGEPAQGTL